MNPLRVGVVGLGHMGMHHVRVCSELNHACQLTAIFDTNRMVVEAVSRKYRVPAAVSMENFADHVDAATICTPTATHFGISRFLLERGKHLLVEKPLAETSRDAHMLVLIAQERQCILQVGHVERFNPALEALECKLRNPRFLEVIRLSPYPYRNTDIGVVLDLMIHDIEVVLHIVQSPVINMDSVGIAVLSKNEDIANARIRFQNGCIANVTASRISNKRLRKIRLFQKDAYLSLDYYRQSSKIHRLVDGKIVTDRLRVPRGEPLKFQLASFISCACEKKRPRVSGHEAAVALDVALEITRQIWHSGPHNFFPLSLREKNLGNCW
ncbi:Putative oxidoreductase YceM [Candidatus Xiphinematobacter sp. Idaho Grape]|uniref:Gfo/Idh/MocA family protein n=1 Tax=Candidatus Xiphinematobacter sp. Idaho Grape TaxID=1704307 RepID=UPI000705D8FD|nr:Gfo/Idh/MocA family oxidoreductase [Candidatus Xiphinematobacter sp. Idaho Grape]ALJ56828.1 Putative oxidoreductase YceM [Candidatus Xiphinematobacter sp. Idaho Grape]